MTTLANRELRIRGRFIKIGHLESDGVDHLADPDSFLATIRAARPAIDIFTFMQTLPHRTPAFSYPLEWDNFAALPVATFEHWWQSQIDNKTRNMVRKADKKGLVVKEAMFDDAFVAGIHAIYNETPVRQGKKFWHYGKPVDIVKRENATFMDQSVYIGAYVGGDLVGFVKLVIDTDRGQACMMQILSMIKHRDKAPTNALIAQAVRSCAERRVPYLVYAHLSYGKKHHDSLVAFKQSNGFERLDVPRYYIPLTRRGSLAMRLGLHHRMRDRLPSGTLAIWRRLRRSWYARRCAQNAML